jgi:hypothetical protein
MHLNRSIVPCVFTGIQERGNISETGLTDPFCGHTGKYLDGEAEERHSEWNLGECRLSADRVRQLQLRADNIHESI